MQATVQKIHPCYALNRLWRSDSKNPNKWLDIVKVISSDPYATKSATGKEIALTLHGLSQVPREVSDHRVFHSLVDRIGEKLATCIQHGMNEKSVAITALSVFKLEPLMRPETMLETAEAVSHFFASQTNLKDPKNMAQAVYAVSLMRAVPIAVKADMLTGWAKAAIVAAECRMQVKDIVQLVTAYSHSRVVDVAVLKSLESATARQLQYFDAFSVGAVVGGFGKLGFVPSDSLIAGLLATANQHDMNAQTMSSILFGLSVWSESVKLDKHGVDSILSRFTALYNDVPNKSLLVVLKAVHRLQGNIAGLNISPVTMILDNEVESVMQRFREESDSMVAEAVSVVLQTASDEKGKVIVSELLLPRLNVDSRDVRSIIKMVGLVAQSLPNFPVEDAISQICALPLEAHVIVPLVRALSDSHPVLALKCLEQVSMDQLTQCGIEELAALSWRITGQVHDNVMLALSPGSAWLNGDSVVMPIGVFFKLCGGAPLEVPRSVSSPPPGIVQDPICTEKLLQAIDSVDPEFRLRSDVAIIVTRNGHVTGPDWLNACSFTREVNRVIFVPQTRPINEQLVVDVLIAAD